MTTETAPTVSTARGRADGVALGVLIAVSIAVRIQHLSRPLLGDEAITFANMVLGRSFGGILFGPFDGNNHLLNSMIMKAVHLGFGENPVLMRLPNLLMVVAAVVVLYFFASAVLGRAAGFVAALLLALHPAMVLFSVSCRGYAGMVLFTLLSVALLLRLMHRFSWTVWAGCAASGAVAAGFHLFAVNVLVAQILVVAFEFLRPSIRERSSTGRLTAIALAPLTALVLVVGGLLPMLSHDPANGVRFPFQKAFPAALLSFLGDHRYGTRLDVLSITLLGLAIVGWFALRGHPLLRRLISLLLLSPAALYGFSSVAPVFTLHPRFFTYLLPFVFLLVAAGLRSMVSVTDAIRPRSALLDVAARGIAVVIVGLTAIALVGRAHVPQKDPWAKARIAVAAFVDAHPDALFPTNDPGFVRVRLRQQPNMHRVPTAPSVKTIRARLAEHPTDPVYYIYVRQKRFTESDLIHFKGDTPPDVLSQRDRWLRGFLDRNAELELDIPPRVRIYRLRP